MATVSAISIIIVVCLAVANGQGIIGGFGNCTTSAGVFGFKCASGNCIASNLWRNLQCDCCGQPAQAYPPPPSCTDCSDELCLNNQTACDFGKCIPTTTLASAANMMCTYDCIQSSQYTTCIQQRIPSTTTMDIPAWVTFCSRLALRPPMDCNSTATCPCLTQMQNYCANTLYNSQFSRENVTAGQTSMCGTNIAGTSTGCTNFCSTNQPTAVASMLQGVCMADPVTSKPYCSCRMPMVVPCTLCTKGTC